MRPLRRSRTRHTSTVPVVDDGYGCLPDPGDHDYIRQQEQERSTSASNDVADFVIYFVQSEAVVGNALKARLYEAAIARFKRRLPPEMIRMLVDATILKDKMDRERAVRLRKAEAARKAEDGARRSPLQEHQP